jgi:hypothetical protein
MTLPVYATGFVQKSPDRRKRQSRGETITLAAREVQPLGAGNFCEVITLDR